MTCLSGEAEQNVHILEQRLQGMGLSDVGKVDMDPACAFG
jgi:hypothetical protein